MKSQYHRLNLFTFNEIIEACGDSQHVESIPINHTDFFNYDKLLNTLYKKFPTGGVLKYQIFSCEEKMSDKNNDMMKVKCLSSALPDADEDIVVMRKGCSNKMKNVNDVITINGVRRSRSEYIRTANPEQLYDRKPGLKPRKQVEMYTKWRPLLPENKRDITCPRPDDEEIKEVKAEIVESRERNKRKKETHARLSMSKPKATNNNNAAATTKKRKR